MAKSVYFNNCIEAIRHTTYGRDNRKPIADSIEELKSVGHIVRHLISTEAVLNTDIIDWYEYIPHTIYTNYEPSILSGRGCTVSDLGNNDYLMNDGAYGDSVSWVSADDYLLNFGDRWSVNHMDEGSYIEYEAVPHYDTYTWVLHSSNE